MPGQELVRQAWEEGHSSDHLLEGKPRRGHGVKGHTRLLSEMDSLGDPLYFTDEETEARRGSITDLSGVRVCRSAVAVLFWPLYEKVPRPAWQCQRGGHTLRLFAWNGTLGPQRRPRLT